MTKILKPWTEAENTYLREQWANGETASYIARGLGNGRTRCSVLGRVHRLNLAIRSQKSIRVHGSRVKPVLVPRRVIETPAEDPGPADPPLTLENIGDNQCRWPYGDGTETRYCGAQPKDRKLPYCAYHLGERRQKNQAAWGQRSQNKA